jgi:hypothetical protein
MRFSSGPHEKLFLSRYLFSSFPYSLLFPANLPPWLANGCMMPDQIITATAFHICSIAGDGKNRQFMGIGRSYCFLLCRFQQ